MPPTPFMGLVLPTVGVTLGPTWASEINSAMTVVDAHDHTIGNGVPIPTSGISLNADLPFNSFNATLLRSTRFVNQGSPLSGSSDLACLYASSGNLYYNNSSGQQVRITAGAGLDASSVGGFGGDYGTSTASAFYTSATSTFTFWQNANVSALMDVGATTIHPSNSATLGVTLKASTSLSGSYNLTFPISLPASTKIMTVDASGNIGDAYDVDNSTLTVSSNLIQIANNGVNTTQIADGAVTLPKMGGSNIVVSGPLTFSTSSATLVDLGFSCTITTSGHPVLITLYPGAGTFSGIQASGAGRITIRAIRNGTVDIGTATLAVNSDGGSILPPACVSVLDYTIAGTPQTVTYTFGGAIAAGTLTLTNVFALAREVI